MRIKKYKKRVVLFLLMFFAGYCFSDSAKKMSEKKDGVPKAERIDDVEVAEKIEDDFCSLVIESNAFNAEVYINGIFKGFIKVLFYTIIPIGFVNYLPIKII